MLDLKYLRDNLEEAERRLATRGGTLDLAAFRDLDAAPARSARAKPRPSRRKRTASPQLIGQTRDKSQVQGEDRPHERGLRPRSRSWTTN